MAIDCSESIDNGTSFLFDSRRPRRVCLSRSLGVGICFAGFATIGDAATLFVDTSLTDTCLDTYDPGSRSCGSGNDSSYATLDAALSAVSPGDTLYLRAGTYGQLSVQISGTPAEPIVIAGYLEEVARVSAPSAVGLWLIDKSDVTIKNLQVTNVLGFGRLEGATRIEIDSVDFSQAGASGTTGALKLVRSGENRVTNSSFRDGSDLLLLQDDSDLNVLQGNTFGRAAHSLISIRCSSQNVIRDNQFNNPDQKAVEIYDCEGVSDAPVRLDDTKRNLIERNRFYGTRASAKTNDYNAIQHGAQHTIVRLNVFANNFGGGVNYQYYSKESLVVYGNRLYNNTFYQNRCHGIIGQAGPSSRFFDNRVTNNLLYGNTGCGGGGRQQTSIEDRRGVILTNNFEAKSDPGFIDAAAGDFRLGASSSQIDAGAFLTRTPQAGSGASLRVEDASAFYDGFGIKGESGDLIRLEGGTEVARVISIDYAAQTLQLDQNLSWGDGTGVHIDFAGERPDVGAFETSSTGD
jgi:hypothetical protein